MPRSVLAVGAHPDDHEILCAGTLARYRKMGWRVAMVNVANGNVGHYEIPSAKLRTIRRAEALAAGRVIGAAVYTLDVPDGQIANDHPTRLKLIDIVRCVRPDVVITHSPACYMGDHLQTSALALDAAFLATAPLIRTRHPHLPRIPAVYFMDTLMGIGFHPTEYVDITETIGLKRRMLECHVSQVKWLRDHDGTDIVEDMTAVARFRGLQCGRKYAEGFTPYLAWGRVRAERVLP
jgi:LmbE family N-acetylglucosaminyl deacetylase